MFEIATAVLLFGALLALILFWLPLLRRLTELAARYILPMRLGAPGHRQSAKREAPPASEEAIRFAPQPGAPESPHP